MDVDARVEAWAWLSLVPSLPTPGLCALLRALGDPAEVRRASRATLARWVPDTVATAIRRGPAPFDLERTLAWLATPAHWLVAWDDADYPAALLAVAQPPPAFYYAGRRELVGRAAIAITGSHHATAQGQADAAAFAQALSAAGLTIVSELAPGIAAAAQRGGLAAAGGSIAVVASGLDGSDRPDALAERLAAEGGLLSESAPGTAVLPANLSRRDHLISGLARGVLVIEATLAGGSLRLARVAAEAGREVFAMPGSIHSPFSKGAHRLIKEGAKLVETADDVLAELRPREPGQPPGQPTDATATPASTPVLAAMGADKVGIPLLVARTGLPADTIAAALIDLQHAGRVAALPGGAYRRLP